MTSAGDVQRTAAIGANVVDARGQRVGAVVAVGLRTDTAQSDWLVLQTADGVRTAVPAFAASLFADGTLIVPFPASLIASAPAFASDLLTREVAVEILEHYGLADDV